MSSSDQELIEAARSLIVARYKPDFHHIGCALRTRSGRVFRAVHIEACVGRVTVCAEAIAIGIAAAEGEADIETIVALDRDGNLVAPCGMCRELIADYSNNAFVLLADGAVVPVLELLPHKYRRQQEAAKEPKADQWGDNEMDFLTPEQRSDAVAETLATLALRVINRNKAASQNPEDQNDQPGCPT